MHGWDDSVSLSRISFWPSSFFAGELLVGRVTPLVFQAVVLRCERNPDESTNEICASDFFGIIGFHHGIRDNTHFPPGIDRNGNSCSGLGLTNRTLAETIGELHPCSIVGLWRSWERASMAWKRSSVRSRSGPPNNPLKIKQLQEEVVLLLFATLCHFVSSVQKVCANF